MHVLHATVVLVLLLACARGQDWPMWRHDANRTAACETRLPAKLHLHWTWDYGKRKQVWDDPLNNDLMTYDRVFEPIVLGPRLFVGFNDSDKVVALDIDSGKELWTFRTDGPVRLAPVGWRDRIFVTSDDGYLYCLGATDGRLLWKVRGGPSARKVLGNERVISAWPARGGAVVRDGTVYFAASIWPFMGVFVYALDATTGAVRWAEDSTGSLYLKQPHGAPSFAGLAPQGSLVATERFLLVPGRTLPAVLDRSTGELRHFNLNTGKGQGGGTFLAANERSYFVHVRKRVVASYDLGTGVPRGFAISEPVLVGDHLYAASNGYVQVTKGNRKWRLEGDVDGDVIKAGDRLYVSGVNSIQAVELPKRGGSPRVSWRTRVDGKVMRLLAARGRLFAVTEGGRLMAFGSARRRPVHHRPSRQPLNPPTAARTLAQELVRSSNSRGYALCFGVDDGSRLEAVLRESSLHVVAVDPDRDRVERLRRRLDAAGLYGSRVAVHVGDARTFEAPPYIAHLVWVGESVARTTKSRDLEAMFRSVRPYGGCLWLPVTGEAAADLARAAGSLERATTSRGAGGLFVRREGALPGAADWTHQYGDIANTVKSDDRRVKAPLGLLWFGGSSNTDVLPRHGHGPPEQVVGGRLFVEGMSSISARDVYTGRVLWQKEIEGLDNYGVYFDHTYTDTPLKISYNQVHIPGANARGTNFVATEDALYVAAGPRCRVLDAPTGKERRSISLPRVAGERKRRDWGFIGVHGDTLLGGWGFADFTGAIAKEKPGQKPRAPIVDRSASRGLVAFDRRRGSKRWSVVARHGFLHNGIVAGGGRIYCLDRLPRSIEQTRRKRGERVGPYRILVLDAATGRRKWEIEEGVFGTWLAYSEKHDVLLQAGARGRDRMPDEVGKGMAAYRGRDGKLLWADRRRAYTGPCILHGDHILTNVNSYRRAAGAFDIRTGTPRLVANPLTGEPEPWTFTRAYGCSAAIASEFLLTYRSGAASIFDLTTHSGTVNLGGLRSGCTSNLVVANGVLNAPDFTRTCICLYQNQTSMALVPMSEAEMWSVTPFGFRGKDALLRSVGINLGAPGDRRGVDGTLWLEHPVIGGESPSLDLRVKGTELGFFRRHPSRVRGDQRLPWVFASGARNIRSLTLGLRPRKPRDHRVVAKSEDDVEENAEGRVVASGSDLRLGGRGRSRVIGLRFENLPIARGGGVRSAHLQFTVGEASKGGAALRIQVQAIGNAPPFSSTRRDVTSRTRSTASVAWKPKAWAKVGAKQRTPDLRGLLREIVARPDWRPGNAVVFLITGSGNRVARAAMGDPRSATRLTFDADAPLPVDPNSPARAYTVRLCFAEPADVQPGQRVFDVSLQERRVLRGFDVTAAAGGRLRGVVREFRGIRIVDRLRLDLTPDPRSRYGPVLCGVWVRAE